MPKTVQPPGVKHTNNFTYNFQDQDYTVEHPLENFVNQLDNSLLKLSCKK